MFEILSYKEVQLLGQKYDHKRSKTLERQRVDEADYQLAKSIIASRLAGCYQRR